MYTLCSLSSTCCNFSLIGCFFNWFWYQKFCTFLKVIAFPFYLIRAYMNQWITQQKVQMFMIISEIIGFGYVFLMNSMFFLGLRMQFRSRRLCHCIRDSASWIVTDADLFPLRNSWLYLNSLLIPFHRLYIRSIFFLSSFKFIADMLSLHSINCLVLYLILCCCILILYNWKLIKRGVWSCMELMVSVILWCPYFFSFCPLNCCSPSKHDLTAIEKVTPKKTN